MSRSASPPTGPDREGRHAVGTRVDGHEVTAGGGHRPLRCEARARAAPPGREGPEGQESVRPGAQGEHRVPLRRLRLPCTPRWAPMAAAAARPPWACRRAVQQPGPELPRVGRPRLRPTALPPMDGAFQPWTVLITGVPSHAGALAGGPPPGGRRDPGGAGAGWRRAGLRGGAADGRPLRSTALRNTARRRRASLRWGRAGMMVAGGDAPWR